MKKTTKILLIFLVTTILFNCSDDNNPETTPENQAMRLDSIISTNNNTKIYYNYDSNNVCTGGELIDSFEEDGGVLNVSRKTLTTYNASNLVSTSIDQEWNDTEYINLMKTDYTYNSNLNVSRKTISEWESNNWHIAYEYNYIYNASILTEILENPYDNPANQKSVCTYENNVLKKIEYYNKDENTNDWENIPRRKKEYLYDTNMNITDIIDYNDNNPYDGIWEQGYGRIEYEYDNAYAIDDLILPFFEVDNMPLKTNHMITKMKVFESSGNDNWTINADFEYFYSDVSN